MCTSFKTMWTPRIYPKKNVQGVMKLKQKRCWLRITIHLKSQISWKKVCVWQNPETCEAMWDSTNVERQSLTTVALLFPTAFLIVGLLGKGNDFLFLHEKNGCSFSSFIVKFGSTCSVLLFREDNMRTTKKQTFINQEGRMKKTIIDIINHRKCNYTPQKQHSACQQAFPKGNWYSGANC